jgi:hypothetical protein
MVEAAQTKRGGSRLAEVDERAQASREAVGLGQVDEEPWSGHSSSWAPGTSRRRSSHSSLERHRSATSRAFASSHAVRPAATRVTPGSSSASAFRADARLRGAARAAAPPARAQSHRRDRRPGGSRRVCQGRRARTGRECGCLAGSLTGTPRSRPRGDPRWCSVGGVESRAESGLRGRERQLRRSARCAVSSISESVAPGIRPARRSPVSIGSRCRRRAL